MARSTGLRHYPVSLNGAPNKRLERAGMRACVEIGPSSAGRSPARRSALRDDL